MTQVRRSTHVGSSSHPAVGDSVVSLEHVLARVLSLGGLVDLFHLVAVSNYIACC
jgi:hypothetical protein